MPKYLQLNEIATYCEYFADDITETTINIAEGLVDAYCGKDLTSQSITETVKINRKNKGKLNNTPVASITSVTGVYISSTGLREETLDKNNVVFDSNGYFEYLNILSPVTISYYLSQPLYGLKFVYTCGYVTIPTGLKKAVAMLCQNLAERQSFNGIKSLTKLDFTAAMFDDSLFTSDIRLALSKYKDS